MRRGRDKKMERKKEGKMKRRKRGRERKRGRKREKDRRMSYQSSTWKKNGSFFVYVCVCVCVLQLDLCVSTEACWCIGSTKGGGGKKREVDSVGEDSGQCLIRMCMCVSVCICVW